MIKKFCYGLEVSVPERSVKEVWRNGPPMFEELVSGFYWKNFGSESTQEKYKRFFNDTGIEITGELDEESYKKSVHYQTGYLEWFWMEYPEHKRYNNPQYRKDLKKLIFTSKHPQIKVFRDGYYKGIKREIKHLKKVSK